MKTLMRTVNVIMTIIGYMTTISMIALMLMTAYVDYVEKRAEIGE